MKAITSALRFAAAATGTELSEERMAAYCTMLGNYDHGAVTEAIKQRLLRSPFFPSIAAIVALLEEDTESQATAAWVQVWRAVCSRTARPSIDADPRLSETVRLMGGWGRLAMVPEKSEPFERKRWIECFEQTTRAHDRAALSNGTTAPSESPAWLVGDRNGHPESQAGSQNPQERVPPETGLNPASLHRLPGVRSAGGSRSS